MEDKNIDVNKTAEVENSVEESSTPETNETEVQVAETPASESETEESVATTEVDQPKKGAESRIRELNSKLKEERAQRESLSREIAKLTGSVEPNLGQTNNGYVPGQPLVEPGEEVTIEELNRRQAMRDQYLLQQSRNETAFMLQRQQTLERINRESSETEKNYPQLNPDSDEYDKELSESISQATLAYVKTNPAGSLTKFVDGLMKPYMRSINKSVASQQGEIAKQASQTAMRPNSVPTGEKPASEMSIEELEAKLGKSY